MPPDIRLALILLAVAGMAPGLRQRLAADTGEKLDRTQEGWPILIGLRLIGVGTMLLFVLWLIHPPWFDWATWPSPVWTRWLGVILYALSNLWLFWMYRTLGRNITDTVVTRRDAHLVTSGPYRYVRNPMYLGVLMAGASLGFALSTWLLPLAAFVIFGLLALRTPIEERNLIARFGDAYRDYMRRVPPYFPRLGPRRRA